MIVRDRLELAERIVPRRTRPQRLLDMSIESLLSRMNLSRCKAPRFSLATLLYFVAGVAAICALCSYGIRQVAVVRKSNECSHCVSHLKQIASALQSYHHEYNCFPPAYICDESGAPCHSWRVLLLPFLGRQDLYDRYRFDETWNGTHNRALIGAMPPFYACASDKLNASEGRTHYLALCGEGTIFPDGVSTRYGDLLHTHYAAMVAEMSRSVCWLSPADCHLPMPDAHSETVECQGNHDGCFQLLFSDGHVARMPVGIGATEVSILSRIAAPFEKKIAIESGVHSIQER